MFIFHLRKSYCALIFFGLLHALALFDIYEVIDSILLKILLVSIVLLAFVHYARYSLLMKKSSLKMLGVSSQQQWFVQSSKAGFIAVDIGKTRMVARYFMLLPLISIIGYPKKLSPLILWADSLSQIQLQQIRFKLKVNK